MSGPVTYIITIVHLGPLKYANDKKITHTHTQKNTKKKKKKKKKKKTMSGLCWIYACFDVALKKEL